MLGDGTSVGHPPKAWLGLVVRTAWVNILQAVVPKSRTAVLAS